MDKALTEIFAFIDECNEYVQKNKIWEVDCKDREKKLYEDLAKLNKEKVNMKALERTVEEISRRPLEVDKETVGFVASQKINILMQRLYHDPRDLNTLKSVEALLRVLSPLSLNLDLWKAQNAYFAISTEFLSKPRRNEKEKEVGELPPPWLELFKSLGDYLQVKSQ